MKFLNVLGWIFAPLLMLIRSWGALNVFQKIIGILWGIIVYEQFMAEAIPILVLTILFLWIMNKKKADKHICQYCGQPVLFIMNAHTKCQKQHRVGNKDLAKVITAAFSRRDFDITHIKQEIEAQAKLHFANETAIQKSVLKGWQDAVDIVLEDRLLSFKEEQLLMDIREAYHLDTLGLYNTPGFRRLTKASILREVKDGIFPKRVDTTGVETLPFNFLESERLIWGFPETTLFEVRKKYKISGSSYGFSTELYDDIYMSSGSFRGEAIESETLAEREKGILAVTNEHIYFANEVDYFRMKYDEIVAFQPYSDGIGIQRDSETEKLKAFGIKDKDDLWFCYNLIRSLAKAHLTIPKEAEVE